MFCYRKTGNSWGRRKLLGWAKSIVRMCLRNNSAKLAGGIIANRLRLDKSTRKTYDP